MFCILIVRWRSIDLAGLDRSDMNEFFVFVVFLFVFMEMFRRYLRVGLDLLCGVWS